MMESENLGNIKEILELKGRTMLFKISAKKEHYVRRNIPFPVVKIKTDQLLLQQLCPDLLALDENDFNSDGGISSKGFQDTPSNLRSVGHLTSSVVTKVQSTGGISSKVFQDTPSNFRSVGHLTSSVVTKVQSMPPISSQVLADTPTNLRAAINLTSSVNTKVQASRGRSSQSFQGNTTNCHAIGQLLSQNLTTETRDATNRMRSNVTIHPARNLEEEFSTTLQDTSKVMEENGVVVGSVQHEENNVPKCIPTINGVEPTCPLPSTSLGTHFGH
nr:uncharacterized protein LOC109163473 [Ipomoea batatas]